VTCKIIFQSRSRVKTEYLRRVSPSL
jgi:hypothetical protein